MSFSVCLAPCAELALALEKLSVINDNRQAVQIWVLFCFNQVVEVQHDEETVAPTPDKQKHKQSVKDEHVAKETSKSQAENAGGGQHPSKSEASGDLLDLLLCSWAVHYFNYLFSNTALYFLSPNFQVRAVTFKRV